MLAEYASRMTVRNQIVIGALTGDEPYDPERYRIVAHDALEALESESLAAADRLAEERRWAASMDGRSEHIHDYRMADETNLEHRELLSIALADRLKAWREDETRLAGLVESARQDAWAEVGDAIAQSLVRAWIPVDETYRRERKRRMRLLVSEDLPRLMIEPRN